jgi:hypothetical protein
VTIVAQASAPGRHSFIVAMAGFGAPVAAVFGSGDAWTVRSPTLARPHAANPSGIVGRQCRADIGLGDEGPGG